MKYLRINHYAYFLITLALVVFSGYKFVTSFRSAQAEVTPVTITTPTPNQQIPQGEQTITGTGPALKQVVVLDGETKIGDTTVLANGTWSLAWNNQLPGTRTLKAIVPTGSFFTADAIGRYPVHATDINSGQVTQNYPAGFAQSSDIVYDSSTNKAFVVNSSGRTISIVDAETKAVVDTLPYAPNASLVTAQNYSVEDVLYDQARHNLYILESTSNKPATVYIVDMQVEGVTATIALNNSDFSGIDYIGDTLQLDPSADFLYLYGNPYGVTAGRINLSTNTPDASWNKRIAAPSLLTAPNGDVYFINASNGKHEVYTSATDTVEELNIDNSVCSTVVGDNFAMSNDRNTLYLTCVGTENSGAPKVVAYSTQTATVVATFPYNLPGGIPDGEFLTNGVLPHNYLLLGRGNTTIRIINTQNNTEGVSISGFGGEIETNSLVVDDTSMYFTTYDYPDNHIYTANLLTGSIANTWDYSVFSSFYRVSSAVRVAGSPSFLILAPQQPFEKISFVNLSTGALSALTDGMGTAYQVHFAKGANRLFGIGYPGLPNSTPSQIPVANTVSGEYEASIQLPDGFNPDAGVVSGDGATFYVAGTFAAYTGNNDLRVYAIDTDTLQVEGVYDSIGVKPDSVFNSKLTIGGGGLFFITSSKLYRIDLANDSTQSINTPGCFSSCLYAGIAVDSTGENVAAVTGQGKVTIFNSTNLAVERVIDLGASIYNTSLSFDSQDNLLIGMSNASTPQVQPVVKKYSITTGENLSSVSLTAHTETPTGETCIVGDIQPTNQSQYWLVRTICIGSSGGYRARDSISLIDSELNIEISNRNLKETGAGDEAILQYQLFALNGNNVDIQVSSATQEVKIIGGSLTIVEPPNNATLAKGTKEISGAASPGSSVLVKINNAAIGTVQADQTGLWKIDHTFGSTGNFTIRAEQDDLSDQHAITVEEIIVDPPGDPDDLDNPDIPEVPVVTKPPTTPSKEEEALIKKQGPAAQASLREVESELVNKSIFTTISANIRSVLRKVPLPIVSAFPYFLFLLLLLLAAYYLYQTQKQLRTEQRLQAIFEKQRVLSQEKRNFLELTSHYLRTPLTYIRAGSEMIAKAKPTEAVSEELSQSVSHLTLFIESLIEEAGSNKLMGDLAPPVNVSSPWLSRAFLLPFVGFISALSLFYLSFTFIAGISFSGATYITQILMCFLVAQLFYGLFKNHQRVDQEKIHLEKTIKAEEELDNSRSKLLKDAGEQLQTRTDHLESTLNKFPGNESTSQSIIHQGTTRLQELARTFSLVSHLESKAIGGKAEPIAVRDLAADVITPFTATLQEKKIKLTVEGFDPGITLTTNKAFAQLTLKSLIQNAIDASKEGTNITIKCLHSSGRVAFQVIDHGEGIPKEKLSQLFKPFMRVGPVTTFNREGIGLSLFIDRLIMHALGGEVEIMSKLKEGTVATLTFGAGLAKKV